MNNSRDPFIIQPTKRKDQNFTTKYVCLWRINAVASNQFVVSKCYCLFSYMCLCEHDLDELERWGIVDNILILYMLFF